MTTSYHHGNLRQALLDEASAVLEASGPGAVSLRALARSIGVSHAAPGHHFSSRKQLLAELAADGYRDLADAMDAAIESSPRPKWLLATGKAYIRFGLANPERYRMMFGSNFTASECPDRLLEESNRAYALLLTAAHGEAPDMSKRDEYSAGPEEIAAWSVVHGIVTLWLDGQLAVGVPSEKELLALSDRVLSRLFG